MIDIEIIKRNDQAEGNFNNGEILEKKPVGFPQDEGKSRPYSNIFYWAHAWTNEKKSTIGLHPHQGFEICSFVLRGEINHYDTKQERWISLKEGDVQIIRSGSGISHSEELLEKSEIFQIWFDPDLSKSLSQDASYDDYKPEDFHLEKNEEFYKKTISGPGSKMKMDSKGIEIFEYQLSENKNVDIVQEKEYIYSYFLIEGCLRVDEKTIEKGDFFKVQSDEKVILESELASKVFVIKSPKKTGYVTYAEKRFL
jgi:redox-sensitive bicupin YhaK (pirin superfamily)